MAKTNIFITGGTGFIGKHFIEKIKKSKINGTIFILSRTDIKFNDKRFKVLRGNLEQIKTFEKELLACEYVFHLAANANFFGKKEVFTQVNYQPTVDIVEILRESKRIKNFIFTSTIGAVDRHKSDNCSNPLNTENIPSPRSYYGKSKLQSEVYIKKSGIPYTIIRPTWVYGKDMRLNSHINVFVKMVREKSLITKFLFPGKVSVIHVDDLAKSLVNCLFNDAVINKIYFAETDSSSIGDIFKLIKNRMKDKTNDVTLPRMNFLMKRIHSFIPLSLANLFLNYLYASDPSFKKDLLHKVNTINFTEGINDVIDNYYCNEKGAWIITGANSGIGLALAAMLDEKKIKLILLDKELNNLKEYTHQQIIKIDLMNEKEIFNLKHLLEDEKIYCLVNNAGIGYRKSFNDLTINEIFNVVDVNVIAPMLLSKILISKICETKGALVNIASSIAYNPLPNMSLYSASKAFLVNWSESLTYELKTMCNVITVSPSGTATNFQSTSGVKHDAEGKGLLKPDQVAKIIWNAVEKNKKITIIGFKTKIILFISSFLPRTFNITFWGKMFEKMR